MLRTESDPQVAEMLLSEAADIFVVDMYANDLLHQVMLFSTTLSFKILFILF